MGYMGFGMRKEDYKRKPKRAFTKLKELYGNDTPTVAHDPNAAKLTSDDVFNKPRLRMIYDMKGFQIIKLGVLLILIGAVINSTWIQPWLFKRNLKSYKEGLLNAYSEDHQFLLNSGDQLGLQYFEFDSLKASIITATNGFEFRGSGFYISAPEVVKIGTWNANAIDVELVDGKLKVVQKNSTKVLDQWVMVFQSDTTSVQYYKILEQLSIDPGYIQQLRNKLKATKSGSVSFKDSTTSFKAAYSSAFGSYEYLRTNKEVKESKRVLKIDSITYLRQRY